MWISLCQSQPDVILGSSSAFKCTKCYLEALGCKSALRFAPCTLDADVQCKQWKWKQLRSCKSSGLKYSLAVGQQSYELSVQHRDTYIKKKKVTTVMFDVCYQAALFLKAYHIWSFQPPCNLALSMMTKYRKAFQWSQHHLIPLK